MAGRDASRVQLDFPQLVADLIRQLRLTGTVGLLELSDQVTPVYIVAQREGALALTTNLPNFTSAAVFDGFNALPAANTVVADTGALPAGTYDVILTMSRSGRTNAAQSLFSCQHRNAANAATLAVLSALAVDPTNLAMSLVMPLLGYDLALNERIRMISPTVAMTQGGLTGSIFAQIRPTP